MNEKRLAKARRRLLDEIQAEARSTEKWTGRGAFSGPVMAALDQVPREAFVRESDVVSAYVNRPQSIGFGQTISQPYIVALMTELLDLGRADRVLEVGTGSGYQTAVLAEVAGEVFSIEAVEALATAARRRLRDHGYHTVEVLNRDGFAGWPEKAPFDAIMVTAAPERIPQTLVDQLKSGGRMVVPVGRVHDIQFLYLGTKDTDGRFETHKLLPVAFVPMVGNERPEEPQ
ncbi:MAG: protein-L-isoaspartate(D-aspartate) O-methyltransferase [Rhodospirillales bacterium]|jgi:protein-L-isoaspartate(D-aspartate) O-methyltransferase|nr:protein-L-isoaspartate(D-aspartate) O-methyltransferase [Rhodospirillales bacterium]MDP7651988.1 protein-L-isoaspartate(D-aspartate) O-methyltransferase [Rhodospirillales bacterium]HJO97951.1 protein-L-isoaspartate(D-aspartate) O-methyltransferase [Rhodospirillales bacterium]